MSQKQEELYRLEFLKKKNQKYTEEILKKENVLTELRKLNQDLLQDYEKCELNNIDSEILDSEEFNYVLKECEQVFRQNQQMQDEIEAQRENEEIQKLKQTKLGLQLEYEDLITKLDNFSNVDYFDYEKILQKIECKKSKELKEAEIELQKKRKKLETLIKKFYINSQITRNCQIK